MMIPHNHKPDNRTTAIPNANEGNVNRKCPECSNMLKVYKQDARLYICHQCFSLFPIYSAPQSVVIAPPNYQSEKDIPIYSATKFQKNETDPRRQMANIMIEKIQKMANGIQVDKNIDIS